MCDYCNSCPCMCDAREDRAMTIPCTLIPNHTACSDCTPVTRTYAHEFRVVFTDSEDNKYDVPLFFETESLNRIDNHKHAYEMAMEFWDIYWPAESLSRVDVRYLNSEIA